MNGVLDLVRNTGLSLALNVTLRAAGLFTFIAIGRWGNAADAGTFSLALGYLAVLTTVFAGTDDVLVRETARQPQRTLPLLATYGLIRFVLGVLAWLLLFLLFLILRVYSSNELTILMVVASSIIIDTFSAIGQSVLNAHGNFGGPLAAIAVGAVAKVVGALVALDNGHGLLAIALAWPLGSVVTAVVMMGVMARNRYRFGSNSRLRLDPKLLWRLIPLIPSFSATGFLAGIEYQVDVVLLSILLTHEDVAWYSAAVTVMLVVLTLSQAYRIAFFPFIVRSLTERPTVVRKLLCQSLAVMGGLALLAASVVFFVSPGLIEFLYASRFEKTIPILQILIWNVPFFFVNVPLVRFMMASRGQSVVWRTLLISLATNVIANLVLIPQSGAIGSAYARLLSSGLFSGVMGWQVLRRLREPTTAPAV